MKSDEYDNVHRISCHLALHGVTAYLYTEFIGYTAGIAAPVEDVVVRIELYQADPFASPQPVPVIGYFECAGRAVQRLMMGMTDRLEGTFSFANSDIMTKPRIGEIYYAQFVFQQEGFWYQSALHFVPGDEFGVTDWVATLLLERVPLDTFFSIEQASDQSRL